MTTVDRLPGPLADSWEWQRRGACRGHDAAQFFHPDGERGLARSRREQAAKAVCQHCPVRAECAAHALTVREAYGVWGGFTEAERMRLLAIGVADDLVHEGRADIGGLEQRLCHPQPAVSSAPTPAPQPPRPREPVRAPAT